MKEKRKKNYINNNDFHMALCEWQDKCWENCIQLPIPNYIGECFYKLAKNRGRHHWFSGYTYIEDMIAEAVLTCIKYCYNYDRFKSNNPFAYFTQYINNTFFKFMKYEKTVADYRFDIIKENQKHSDLYDYNNLIQESEE